MLSEGAAPSGSWSPRPQNEPNGAVNLFLTDVELTGVVPLHERGTGHPVPLSGVASIGLAGVPRLTGSGTGVGLGGLAVELVGHERFRADNPGIVAWLDDVGVIGTDLDLRAVVVTDL